MDQKGDKNLDPDDFRWGLYNYGISITPEDAKTMVSICDRDGNGSINFD